MARGLDRFLDRLRIFRVHPLLAWPLLVGNLIAVWYGWTDYYAAQLATTPRYLWPFVPDSPNAVLTYVAVLVLQQLFRRRYAWLDLLAFVENIKVGLWTVFVLLYYYQEFFSDHPTLRWTLFWLHVGMIGQAFSLHRELRTSPPSWTAYGLVALWFVVHDALDYGPLRLHPYLRGAAWPQVAGVTFFLSAFVLLWAFSWYRPRRAAST